MSGVTDGDRERAWELVRLSYQPCPDDALRDAIAAALAEERERARAPFLVLADEIEAGHALTHTVLHECHSRIRRAAEADA